MTAKEYLMQYKKTKNNIRAMENELTALQERMESVKGINYTKNKVQQSREKDGIAAMVTRLQDLKGRTESEKNEAVILQVQISGQIRKMEQTEYAELLRKRYIEDKGFDQIAKEMGYSPGHIRHMHGWALETFRKKYLTGEIQENC